VTRNLVVGVDLFCGVGGLTFGLQKAGIPIVAGIDVDSACEYPFVENNGSLFIEADIREVATSDVEKLYPPGSLRLLAGCAPCRPFSPFRRGTDNSKDSEWGLLEEYGRLIKGVKPELVTMENVPGLVKTRVFRRFVRMLYSLGYELDYKIVHCPRLGIPQHRRRLVLLASRIGSVTVPLGSLSSNAYRTVRDAIGALPELESGGCDRRDPLHRARALNSTNLRRLRESKPGGTWWDWPLELRSACHRRPTGQTYQSVYARMTWDEPAPTITTQAYNFGTGRFGHPNQDRALSLREAAILQTFPRRYRFVQPGRRVFFSIVGKMIGNSVPPRLGQAIGNELLRAALAKPKTTSLK
jgi:DNA (cytosine-5)-methyltransferase 1